MSRSTSPFLLIVFLLCPTILRSQEEPSTVNKKRLVPLIAVSTVAYGVTLYGLSRAWYGDRPGTSFHFFNDNAEWKQVDKLGHLYSAFYFSDAADRGLRWSGVHKRDASLSGSITGAFLLVPVEVMDGFSATYGASAGDLAADFAGAGLYFVQTRLWDSPRIYPKFSFHRTSFAAKRPEVLGKNTAEETLKDYNGQTYWFSFDLDRFIPQFPRWLNIDLGYGAEGMVYARNNQNIAAGYQSYRQYYIGLDLDLRAIRTQSRLLHSILDVVSVVRLPAPALQFSKQGVAFKPLYF